MSSHNDQDIKYGVLLAEGLGLELEQQEGHDLAGRCIACRSSDAFRLHEETGVAHCYSCQGGWSAFDVAKAVLGDHEQAIDLLVEIGLFEPRRNMTEPAIARDPIDSIAWQKGISADSLRAFGAHTVSPTEIQLPAYGPDGESCTTLTLSSAGGKGRFARGQKAGLFFPHVDSKVRLPQRGEVWHIVEGVKDAAALHDLGLLACGLNTCRLAKKFGRLFRGVEVVLIPDRDRAGEDGSRFTARILRGVAPVVRVAVLPAEFKESGGEDVRDILRRENGRDQVFQAITDARPPDGWDEQSCEAGTVAPTRASAEITLPEGNPVTLEVSPTVDKRKRLVVATRGEIEHRDQINPDSSPSRERFLKKLAQKLGVKLDVLAPLIEPQLTQLADQTVEAGGSAEYGRGNEDEQSQATLAVNMAAGWDLWHTPAKVAYATIPMGAHQETWSVNSRTFQRFLARQFFDQTGMAMNSQALSAASNLIAAKAFFEGDEHPVHNRVAELDGKIYVDLCNADWQVVEVTPDGWRVLDESPVRFRRSGSMLPLPTPVRGGSVNQLRALLNMDDDTWCLVAAWLVAALRPRGPYPVLALFAEGGAGKSTAGRLLRDLIDPNAAPLRAEPKDPHNLMIAANNAWCLAYDNLSYVPPWLSDALCRLSTGGGFATRELYTDQEEIIFDSQRPVLLTSIEEVANRSDLLDRCLIVRLPAIPEDRRRTEAELVAAYEQIRPQILGALLDAVATALRRLPSVTLLRLPRMADFAIWATAAETSFGWSPGTFAATYQRNRESANDVALEASPIAQPLLDLLGRRGFWSGTLTQLLLAIEIGVAEQIKREKSWPKNARSMGSHLRRLSPNLRMAGWQIDFSPRNARQRVCTINRIPAASSPPDVAPVPSSVRQGFLTQTDAISCRPTLHDANDADDATARPGGMPYGSNGHAVRGDV